MPVTRDSLILRITHGGDSVSWTEFNDIYRPFMHNVVRRYGVKEHDACDIVQDAFLTLVRRLPRFEYRSERGRFRGWLKTIVQNLVVDRSRRRGRRREVGMTDAHPVSRSCEVDQEGEAAHKRQILQAALQEVRATSSPATWQCFEEHCLNRRTAADVSEQLGLTCGAVYMNASRTLARVRAKCAESDSEFGSARDIVHATRR